jgi:hypothetical protein
MISIDDKYLSSPEVIVDKEKYEDYYSILKYYKPNPSDTRENKQIYNQNFIRLNYYIKNFW